MGNFTLQILTGKNMHCDQYFFKKSLCWAKALQILTSEKMNRDDYFFLMLCRANALKLLFEKFTRQNAFFSRQDL